MAVNDRGKPGVTIVDIGLGKPPKLGPPGVRPESKSAPSAPDTDSEPDPGDQNESAEDEGSSVPPNPEAVDYRTEAETCGHCSYFQGDMCSHPIVAQQVGPGDSCAAFAAKGDSGEGLAPESSEEFGEYQ